MRSLPICVADLKRTRDCVVQLKDLDIEKSRIFWRGDRIEWMVARGFHAWFFNEIKEERVAWPGPALPAPNEAECRRRRCPLISGDVPATTFGITSSPSRSNYRAGLSLFLQNAGTRDGSRASYGRRHQVYRA